jgi:hypothetical protein
MFIRFFRDDREILINTDKIWKIEVKYTTAPDEQISNQTVLKVPLDVGLENPLAERWYIVFVGSEQIQLKSGADDASFKAIEEIWKNAIKG